jgi:hypothetical protein
MMGSKERKSVPPAGIKAPPWKELRALSGVSWGGGGRSLSIAPSLKTGSVGRMDTTSLKETFDIFQIKIGLYECQ